MNHLRLSEAAVALGARRIGGDPSFAAVSTDSRTLSPGALFVALRGPRFDGHDHIDAAAAAGAVAALVERERPGPLPQLITGDSRRGLGALAALWRARFPARRIAITGSNGKTTVKELVAAILAREGEVLATRGNLNNEIGLPLTLLRLQQERFAVLEMGANHPGEIAYLTALARPHAALITNAGRAHLEGFGSEEGVARAKGEIFAGLAADGVAVYPGDSRWAPLWEGLAGGRRRLDFGFDRGCAVHCDPATAITRWDDDGFRIAAEVATPEGAVEIVLGLGGEHNLRNALAATAGALALGVATVSVAAGLAAVAPVAGRLAPLRGRNGCRLIDDSYNANPESVAAAIALLATAPGERWLVLGDLAELGAEAARLHRELGERACAAGIERLFATGPLCREAVAGFGRGARHFDTVDALCEMLAATVGAGQSVLVKGSRSARMERVVAALAGGAA